MNVPSTSEVAQRGGIQLLVEEWKKKHRRGRRTREEIRASLFSIQNQPDVAKWMDFTPARLTIWFGSPIINGDSE
jgi:hypothetical protein